MLTTDRLRHLTLLYVGVMTACLLAGLVWGGGRDLVRVSGVVWFNGRPYPNAVVSFQPVGSPGNMYPGKGSIAITDENGRYVLVYDGAYRGAVVGKHVVRISTLPGHGRSRPPGETGTPDGDAWADRRRPRESDPEYDPIPLTWHEKSQVTFVVPPEGTDRADFHITTEPTTKKKRK
jgi:hypothetical protein